MDMQNSIYPLNTKLHIYSVGFFLHSLWDIVNIVNIVFIYISSERVLLQLA